MKLSSKSRYGLYIAVELTKRYGEQPASVAEIAQCTGVTEKYLEQIIAILKRNNIVTATRGANGGYTLAQSPDIITVGSVIRCLEDDLVIVKCIGNKCSASCSCVSHNLWQKLYDHINNFLDSITLKQLLEENI